VTTQNRFYPDMSNVLVNEKYYSGGKTYQPTYVNKRKRRYFWSSNIYTLVCACLHFNFSSD